MRAMKYFFPLSLSLTVGCFAVACSPSPGPTLAGVAGSAEAGTDSGQAGNGSAGTDRAGGSAGERSASSRHRSGTAGSSEGGIAGSADVQSEAGVDSRGEGEGGSGADGHSSKTGGVGALAGSGPQGQNGGEVGSGGTPGADAGSGPDTTGGRVGTGGTGGSGAGGSNTGGTGGGSEGCASGEVKAAEGACILGGLVDDFGSCDADIYEAEGRNGTWYTYRGLDVGCEDLDCEGVSVPPWADSGCGVWSRGGYDPYYLPDYPDLYAGVGVSLNEAGTFYDVCDYTEIEVQYASDQSLEFYAKWNDVGEYGDRDYVLLSPTSGIETATVLLSSFSGLDCSTLTELQWEPTALTGFGIAVYSVRFKGASTPDCSEGSARCTSTSALEVCSGGTWVASSCEAAQICADGRCLDEDATPVQIHGHLSVSGTRLVDQNGAAVQLKGISTMWLNYEEDGYATNAQALAWMRDQWGISVLRVAMGADEEHPGSYVIDAESKAAMTAQVDTIIQNAIDAGVYVIVDWHAHHTYTEQASEFFAYIATNYGAYPNVLIETYNEPLDVSWTGELKPYHQAVVAAFRDADPNDATYPNVAILGTPNWDQDVDVAAASPLAGVNLMYTAHFYACSHGSEYLAKARAALDDGLPIFVTEWGATDAMGGAYPDDQVCTADADLWHDWMDANGIGWAAWKLDDCDGQDHPDATCLLKLDAPASGGWTSEYLNLEGHVSYVLGKL
jgi:aryl-phospho-beta-D-glucosidase BglC (GH1 family)